VSDIRIFEVGPRDGLQNETRAIATADKVRLIDLLSASGLRQIETTSFVSPKWVPQLADAAEVMAAIRRAPGVRYAVLTPNMHGYERARASRADEVAVFASASEAFSQKNINCSIADSLERFRPLLAAARADDIPVRGYVSCAIACPYSGPVEPAAVAAITADLLDIGCYQVSLGDTIGAGTPATVARLLDAVSRRVSADRLAGHFHDTGGRAIDNVAESVRWNIRCFDASVGGLGGCPYAPGASGNVATGALVDFLVEQGLATGIERERLRDAERFVAGLGVVSREQRH
jgi:hydroxymethylglutaryl-CoA lyase